jgi:flagellin-like hook-associated protein FlgL
MTTLHTNLDSLFGQRSVSRSQSQLSQSVERLSSGLRINRAKDDNAGLGISQELQRQTRALDISRRNAADGISMAQTAEGALSSAADMLQRMKELTTQGANQSLSKDQRKFITSEIAQLKKEINAIAERTSFNGTRLLTGDFSQKVSREFANNVGEIQGGSLAVKADTTLDIGQKSSSTLAGASVIQLTNLNTSGAGEGTYKFSNNAEKVTLTRTLNGKTETQTLILSRTGSTGGQNVTIPPSVGDSFTLNFDALGVSATFKIDTLGTRKSAEDFGALISSVGQVPAPKGWQLVGGADFASGAPTDQVLATITSTGGNLKITTTTGLGAIDGYTGSWTAGTASSIGFIGTVEQVNAALRTLQVDATNGIGNLDIAIAGQFGNSGFSTVTPVTTSGDGKTITIPGWTIWKDRVKLGTDTIGGWLSSNASNAMPGPAPNYSTTSATGTYRWEFSNNTPSGTGTSLRLFSTGITTDSYGVVHGPYVISQESIAIEAGDTVRFKWKSEAGGDDYDSYAYLLNVDTGAQIELLDSTGNVTPWNTSNIVVGTPGNYKFVFLAGTFDASGGTAAGGSLYLDDIQVISATPKPGTVKVLNIATGGSFTVDNALEITAVNTGSVGKFTADDGIYKLSANADAKTVTLNYYDEDGTTLLGTQTIEQKEALGSERYRMLEFKELGVSLRVQNNANETIRFGDAKSGLASEVVVTQNRRASLIGDRGPVFQVGENSRNEVATNVFRDIRLSENQDVKDGGLFNEVGSLISELEAANDPDFALFQTLENRVGSLIDAISQRRSSYGVTQNRLESALKNIGEQYANLTAANSQIQDTDFAWETARLTKLQIGQQAATAMLAQANAIPNVIMALIE